MVLREDRVKANPPAASDEAIAARLGVEQGLVRIMLSFRLVSCFAIASMLAACGSQRVQQSPGKASAVAPVTPPSWGSPWVARSGTWPSPACFEKTEGLLRQMTLAEKVGQMTQASRETVKPGEIRQYVLGSILSGGGSAPGSGTSPEWADMTDVMHREALATRLAIPLVYGVDAVHGHGNVVGATIFPHNIGLGAARDPGLVERLARLTAVEMVATGVDWTFAPVVAAGRDERWGRTYETFSELPDEAGLLGAAAVRGYQGERLGETPQSVIACAKHYAGDGATEFKTSKGALLDQGDTRLSDEDFRRIAIAPYLPSIAAGVGSIMVSFSSVHGRKMHGHRELLTDVLKGELGFRGFLVTDWTGIEQLPGKFPDQVESSVNAGMDMFMQPYNWKDFIATLTKSVEGGRVPMARIDDAVRRIVTVKCEAGLFERGPVDRASIAAVGSADHRRAAKEAVEKSLVLLKNDAKLLPLDARANVVVAGAGAQSLTRQAGGWTVEWQGAEDKPFPGTTIADAMKALATERGQGSVSLQVTGKAPDGETKKPDAAVLVMSEPAYAEGRGDSETLAPSADDLAALDALSARGLPIVVVILSGRPIVIEPHLEKARAWIAAWLPGSAGEGVASVLYGLREPGGKLSHSWPRRVTDLPLNPGDRRYDPLFPHGHGLSFAAVK
jgi:beta-glucosidase